MSNPIRVGFIGNPNCGKTTLFNAYTGANLKVANWPGVTVEKKEGRTVYQGQEFQLIDLPGIYSLTSYTMEETVSRECIMSDEVDVIVDVADASCLERNLYLTLQLIELGKPVILALNMMDIVEERGMEIDLHRLPEMLGIPVVPVSARKKSGLSILLHAVMHHKEHPQQSPFIHHHHGESSHHKHDHHQEYAMVYQDYIEDKIDLLIDRICCIYPDLEDKRWYALKYLEKDKNVINSHPLEFEDIIDRDYEKDIINQKYNFIEEIVDEVLVNKKKNEARTDHIDRYLTSKWLGLPIFLAIMALVFFLTFTIGDFLKGYFEIGLDSLSSFAEEGLVSLHVNAMLISLIVDGIISGVGGILTFLPNIFILFLALAFLEDSGYMSRVAFVMDSVMDKLGLSGRAFIPMLLGFGCSVPAVMASRALEDERDRERTIMLIPFMSCSAKLPIYLVFSQLFFGKAAMLVAYSMYILGLVLGIFVAFVHSKMLKGSVKQPLLIELPEYKTPNKRTIAIYVWSKLKDFLSKAGTTICAASIVMWVLLNLNHTGLVSDMSQSFGASFGKFLVPLLAPAGLGLWQIVVMLISGLAAKEVVASSFMVLFQVSSSSDANIVHMLSGMGFTSLNAYCLLVFCLLYTPCLATVMTIRKETGSTRWTLGLVAFQMVFAWAVTVIIFQTGSLLLG